MATLFTTRIIKKASEGRKRILDAGCGTGIQAVYLARTNPGSLVHGYDISSDAVDDANENKERYGAKNAVFSVSSHDDFQFPYNMDMIYTAESLVGEHELPWYSATPLQGAEEMVRRRFSKFNENLSHGGIYIVTWAGSSRRNADLARIAEECGLTHLDTIEGDCVGYYEMNGSSELLQKTALVFKT